MTTKAEHELTPKDVAARLEVVRALYKLMVSLRQARVDQATPVASKAP